MAADSGNETTTSPEPGIEISAGSLHLRSWTAADGELPPALAGLDGPAGEGDAPGQPLG